MKVQDPIQRLKEFVYASAGRSRCGVHSDFEESKTNAEGGNVVPKYRRQAINLTYEYPEIKRTAKMEEEGENIIAPESRGPQPLTPERVHAIFKRISNEDCLCLGLNPRIFYYFFIFYYY